MAWEAFLVRDLEDCRICGGIMYVTKNRCCHLVARRRSSGWEVSYQRISIMRVSVQCDTNRLFVHAL
jgi:hypothetical protein